MAGETSGAFFTANATVDKTAAGTFVPEIWSDEVIAAYQKSLKMAPLVKTMTMSGNKGDVIHLPKPTRGSANAKAEAVAVTMQANLESETTVTINRHYEYSRLIEDIVEVQALASLRQFYTEDAGYALAKQVDDDLFRAGTGFGSGTFDLTVPVTGTCTGTAWEGANTFFVDASTGLTAYTDDTVVAADVFTDAGFRALIKRMDDADVPMTDRAFIIPPALRSAIMGTERYVSADFREGATVQSGLIGSVYGIDIYVSSNCPLIEDATSNGTGTADVRGAYLIHKDALVLAEQMSVRSQTQYKQEYLSTLYTADTLYGVQAHRPEAGFILCVPDV
jgi:N4-gp56 family major capsid protein